MPKLPIISIKNLNLIMQDIAKNLSSVNEALKNSASKSAHLRKPNSLPRLVAVSKIKPKECILEAYSCGQRHFGENYVQELVEKATNPQLIQECPDIKWHMIGHLQRNKISKLLSIGPSLFVIETVDSEKLASSLNEALSKKGDSDNLNVMVQVNTSAEEAKSGVAPEECVGLVKFIREKCPKLNFIGLMTIGNIEAINYDASEDFSLLSKLREDVSKEFGLDQFDVELSMGMSSDMEKAISMGSTNVRVGSTIFGSRH